jgi:hypothetical protein
MDAGCAERRIDGLEGAVIASSLPVVVSTTSGHETFHFDFPVTVKLTPGITYVARIASSGPLGSDIAVSHSDNLYARGQFLHQGAPVDSFPSTRDMIFTEGLHTAVPEPSSLAGNTADFGGGINNYGGAVTVTACALSGNTAGVSGGGINNSWGTVSVSSSVLSGNSAGELGGGIHIGLGTVSVSSSVLSGNSASIGDNINIYGGRVTVSASTLSGNTAGRLGGGINNDGGTLTVSSSMLIS